MVINSLAWTRDACQPLRTSSRLMPPSSPPASLLRTATSNASAVCALATNSLVPSITKPSFRATARLEREALLLQSNQVCQYDDPPAKKGHPRMPKRIAPSEVKAQELAALLQRRTEVQRGKEWLSTLQRKTVRLGPASPGMRQDQSTSSNPLTVSRTGSIVSRRNIAAAGTACFVASGPHCRTMAPLARGRVTRYGRRLRQQRCNGGEHLSRSETFSRRRHA